MARAPGCPDDLAKFDPKTEKWTFYSWPSRGTGLRDFHLAERGGVLQVSGAYFNANRVARMVIRTKRDVEALKAQDSDRASRRRNDVGGNEIGR